MSAAGSAMAAPPVVSITAPSGGTVHISDNSVVELVATVSDPTITTATLSINGATYSVPVSGGRIEQNVPVSLGNNRVAVFVEHRGQTRADSTTFYALGEPVELLLVLTWEARGEIIDLWVREPSGETCKWDHRTTTTGARLADMSADAIGFGSQAYLAPKLVAGRYRVKVHYWSDRQNDSRSSWTYDGLMGELEAADDKLKRTVGTKRQRLLAERAKIEARLDEWATPLPPQAPVRAEAILFPGTKDERRYRFDVVVKRTGQLTGLGEIDITADELRSARREVMR